jgi:hypothetical protein
MCIGRMKKKTASDFLKERKGFFIKKTQIISGRIPLKTKINLLYLKIQLVTRSKHTWSRLWKPIN